MFLIFTQHSHLALLIDWEAEKSLEVEVEAALDEVNVDGFGDFLIVSNDYSDYLDAIELNNMKIIINKKDCIWLHRLGVFIIAIR